MPRSVTKPNQYAAEEVISTSAGTGTLGLDFGFDANQLVIINDKAESVYLSLDSTSGSTGGFKVKASESLSLTNLRTGAMSLASTSTSTGTMVRVGAWAW